MMSTQYTSPIFFLFFFCTSLRIDSKSKQVVQCRSIVRVCKSRCSFCVDLTFLLLSDAEVVCRKTRSDLSCDLQGIRAQNHHLREREDWPHSYLTFTHTFSSLSCRNQRYFMLWPAFRLQTYSQDANSRTSTVSLFLWPSGHVNSHFVLLQQFFAAYPAFHRLFFKRSARLSGGKIGGRSRRDYSGQ